MTHIVQDPLKSKITFYYTGKIFIKTSEDPGQCESFNTRFIFDVLRKTFSPRKYFCPSFQFELHSFILITKLNFS